jgi:hypothetical protein
MPGSVTLVCHPDDAARSVRGIEVSLGRRSDGALAIGYSLAADPSRLRVPALARPRRADGLWRHTCFELFVAYAGEPGYYEFNFSPSGEWAAYAFRRYREGSTRMGDFNPEIVVRGHADRLELDAVVPLSILPSGPPHVPLHLALSAVIEDQDGMLSHWALKHAPGKPDFHHPDAFALEWEEES